MVLLLGIRKCSMSIKIKVISLKRSIERRSLFLALNKHLVCEFVEAVDGNELSIEIVNNEEFFVHPLPLPSYGAYGCALSHLNMWKIAMESDCPTTVAEDDAIFRLDFLEKYSVVMAMLPADWDIILWGWNFDSILSVDILHDVSSTVMFFSQNGFRRGFEKFQELSVPSIPLRLEKCFGTPAYTISPSGAKKFKEQCFPMKNFELHFPWANRILQNTGIDVAMNRIYPTVNSFVAFPPLVGTKNENEVSTIQKRRDQ